MIFEWIMLGFCSCLIVVSLCCIAWYVIPVFMEWSPKKKSIMQDERYKANTGKKLGDFGKTVERVEMTKKRFEDENLRIWFTDGSHLLVFGVAYDKDGDAVYTDVDTQYWGKEEWEQHVEKGGE